MNATPTGIAGDRYFAVNVWSPALGRNWVMTVQEDSEEDARTVAQRKIDRNAGEKIEWVSQLTYDSPAQEDALADMFNAGYAAGHKDGSEGWVR